MWRGSGSHDFSIVLILSAVCFIGQLTHGIHIRECDEALGMESGAIPDSAITASSSYNVPNVGPSNGRNLTDETVRSLGDEWRLTGSNSENHPCTCRSLDERAKGTIDGRSVEDCVYRRRVTLSKPNICDELHTAGFQNKEYLTLLSEIQKIRTHQIEMDKLVEELRFGGSTSDRITSDRRRDDTRLDHSATDPVRYFECTRNYNALKSDFESLQKINEKLVHKCGAMKLQLEIVEREATNTQSIIFGSMFCGRYSNFDGPATTRLYADEYYGHPTDHNVVYTSPDSSVRTNDVNGPVPSSSGPPPPLPPPSPPPPPCPSPSPSCPQPGAAPAKKTNKDNLEVTDPALKIYSPIPITEEILKTVVLKKPSDVPTKIRVPIGMMSAAKKESNN